MRQLTLIRHAVTDWNTSGRFQGQSDIPLSVKGKAQARALGKRLGKLSDIALLYSSPLKRATQTASIALPDHDIIEDPRLMELHFGTFEGRTLAENELSEAWQQWYRDPFGTQTPGGESYQDLRKRVIDWLQELPDAEHIIAFTHSGTIQMLITHVLGVEYPRWRKRIFLRHTSVTRILFRGDEAMIERVNDTRHLKSETGDPFDE